MILGYVYTHIIYIYVIYVLYIYYIIYMYYIYIIYIVMYNHSYKVQYPNLWVRTIVVSLYPCRSLTEPPSIRATSAKKLVGE